MTTLPLRELMRHPLAVKKLTSKGQSVRITDNGKPLWVLMPDRETDASTEDAETARQEWMDKYFDDLLAEQPLTDISAAQLVMESRGER